MLCSKLFPKLAHSFDNVRFCSRLQWSYHEKWDNFCSMTADEIRAQLAYLDGQGQMKQMTSSSPFRLRCYCCCHGDQWFQILHSWSSIDPGMHYPSSTRLCSVSLEPSWRGAAEVWMSLGCTWSGYWLRALCPKGESQSNPSGKGRLTPALEIEKKKNKVRIY